MIVICRLCKIISICLAIFVISVLIIIIVRMAIPNDGDNIHAINDEVQVSAGGTVPIIFNINRVQNGNAIMHVEGNTQINLIESGTYLINYSLTGSLAVIGEPASFNTGIYQDNILVEGSIASSPEIPAGQEDTLTGSCLVQVANNSNITLIANSSSRIVYQDASIVIVKIN